MLKRFEGKETIGAAIKIVRAGDGLSDALTLAPEAYKSGERITLILEGVIDDITYKRVKDTDAFVRVHRLFTERVVRIDAADAKEFFDAEEARLAGLRDDQAGVTRLPLDDDPLGVFGGRSVPTAAQAAEEAAAEAAEE